MHGFSVLLIVFAINFAIALYLLVAACMFVRPLFKQAEKDSKTGRYNLQISSHLCNILKAFCIIFWILFILSVESTSDGIKKAYTPTSIRDFSIVYLAFTAVVAVGVAFLTERLWKAPSVNGLVTLNLSKTQLVFIKIAILSEIITYPLVVLMMFFALIYFGKILVADELNV